VSSQPEKAIEMRGPITLSIFIFLSLHSPKKAISNHLPPRVLPIINASPKSIPPPTLLFGWLLHRLIEQQPSKTGALPVFQIFDGRHFDAPNKGKTRSACKPGHLAPLLG
jgi:hypothetical protein